MRYRGMAAMLAIASCASPPSDPSRSNADVGKRAANYQEIEILDAEKVVLGTPISRDSL